MKKVLSILVFALLVFVCVSCGSKKDESQASESLITFNDGIFLYDGQAHSLECTVPDGYSVEFFGNGSRSAGKHPVVAVVYDEAGNQVEQIKRFIYIVEFESLTVSYDGNAKSVELNEVPDFCNVSYQGNGVSAVGTHTVTAVLTNKETGAEVAKFTTTIVIEAVVTIDISGIVFNDLEVEYNGNEHYLECTNVPDGVQVSYSDNGLIEVGQYTITATFYDADFNELGSKTATLTIVEPKEPTPVDPVTPPHTATSKFQLVINDYDHYDLTSNGKAWVDGAEHDEYMALGVYLEAGDIVTLFDSENNAGWAITNVNPYSSGSPVGTATGIVIGETGYYDIYVQFLYENDKIYFGPAQ